MNLNVDPPTKEHRRRRRHVQVLTEFLRRLDHPHDMVEQISVHDGQVRVLRLEHLDGVLQQRVVERHDLVGLLETAGGGVVLRRVGIGEGDEDRRHSSRRGITTVFAPCWISLCLACCIPISFHDAD